MFYRSLIAPTPIADARYTRAPTVMSLVYGQLRVRPISDYAKTDSCSKLDRQHRQPQLSGLCSQPPRGSPDNLPPMERMRPTRQAPPQRLGPQVRPGILFANHFLRVGDALPAVVSLQLLPVQALAATPAA